MPMRWWSCTILGLLTLSCEHATELPAVPPPLEDLSTWTVPEVIQPPPTEAPDSVVAKDKPNAAERVYDFTPGTTFAVTVAMGSPLDVILERGEQVRNIAGGDQAPIEASQPSGDTGQTSHWVVKEGADGQGETLRGHVFVIAPEPGRTMGIIITTTKRIYYLTCKSAKTSLLRVVRWRYAPDPTEKPKPKPPGLLPDPNQPTRYHVGYEVAASHPAPSWQPRSIIDDGKKTYILYPEVVLFETVPLVRLIGPNGPQLVNARQYLNVVILDQLIARAELRVGIGEHAETVTITRGTLHTIACPGDTACPVWPQAAATLVRRQP